MIGSYSAYKWIPLDEINQFISCRDINTLILSHKRINKWIPLDEINQFISYCDIDIRLFWPRAYFQRTNTVGLSLNWEYVLITILVFSVFTTHSLTQQLQITIYIKGLATVSVTLFSVLPNSYEILDESLALIVTFSSYFLKKPAQEIHAFLDTEGW